MQAITVWFSFTFLAGIVAAWAFIGRRAADLKMAVSDARERESEAKARGADVEKRLLAVTAELKVALEERGRFRSDAARVDEIKAALKDREAEKEALNKRIVQLEAEKADALANAAAAERRADEMVNKEREAQQAIIHAKDEQIGKLNEFIRNAESALTREFKAISGDVLKHASAELLRTTDGIIKGHEDKSAQDVALHRKEIELLLKPVGDTLDRLDKHVKENDSARTAAEALLNEQVLRLAGASESLSNALRKPVIRGSWGEMTLENALENAGLEAEIDYILQHSTDGEDGTKRTDAVINMPKGRKLIIDSKNLMETYIPLASATDDSMRAALAKNHSKSLKGHVKDLSSKKYWDRYQGLDCVVLFIPHDGMYHAAIEEDAELIREAREKRVFITNPTSLIPLLMSIRYVLNQERLNQSAVEISAVGRDLYGDIARFAGHMATIGSRIEEVAKAYNDAIPNLDRYIIAKSRQLKALGASKGDDAHLPETVQIGPKLFSSKELRPLNHLLEMHTHVGSIAAASAAEPD